MDTTVLEGRMARCTCGKAPVPSDTPGLAFVEFRGEGSKHATEICKHCRFNVSAHGPDAPVWGDGRTAVIAAGCPGFEPTGPAEFDSYYCGHSGWD